MTLNKNKTYKHNIGENIKLWREFKGIKQEDLGKMIGKSKTTMSNIETGKEPANVYIMEEIADALGIEVTQLFTNPQQQLIFNNCTNSNNGINNGTHTINYIMPQDLIDKHFSLMEKIAEKL
jgi:transcriptional regulator with XRE-family HTH domain